MQRQQGLNAHVLTNCNCMRHRYKGLLLNAAAFSLWPNGLLPYIKEDAAMRS